MTTNSALKSHAQPVIASGAKQSHLRMETEKRDCFGNKRLAMTIKRVFQHPKNRHVRILRYRVQVALLVFFAHSALSGEPTGSVSLESHRSLQREINSAQAGDTLVIPPGIYTGNLLIDKRLTLAGVGKPVIRGEGTGSVITITADSCVIQGFTIEHCGTMLSNEDAGILLKANYALIQYNAFNDILFGIYLYQSEHNVISNNIIVGRKELDVGERGAGIHIWNSNYNEFIDNTITDARDGFYIQNASHSWIEGNEAFNVRYGLHYMYADSNTFLNNSFHDNVAGAAIMYSKGIVMRNNVFAHNRGFSSFGILFQDCHGLIADSNVITDNVVGLFFEATTDNIFRHNVIAQNDIALQMFQNSINNTFSENNFVDNLNPLAIVGKRTESQWNVRGRGNYWSSYDGYDLDGDGIGDIPMKIQNVFQYLEGQNANVRVYLYSPASQALAVAAKAFPIININEESDNHPLMQPLDMRALPAVRMMKHLDDTPINGNRRSTHAWVAFPLIGVVVIGFVYRRLKCHSERSGTKWSVVKNPPHLDSSPRQKKAGLRMTIEKRTT